MSARERGSPSVLRLALAAAWHAVRGREPQHYRRVLAVLDAVGRAAPGAVSPQHAVMLRLGLQAATVHFELRMWGGALRLLDTVDSFFPEGADVGRAGDPPMVAEARRHFRETVLPLLCDRGKRRRYLQGAGRRDYGERFLVAVEGLCFEFLRRIDSALPPPDPQQLYAAVWSHAPSGPRPPALPILERYLSDMGHAPSGAVPRPISSARPRKSPSARSTPAKPRPPRRELRPLHALPLEFLSDSEEIDQRRKVGSARDVDREGDRDRYRTHRQGGAHQGARGGEGGDPPPAAAPHLQRQADERREDGGRLQDPGRLRASPGAGPARGRGGAGRGAGLTAGHALRPRVRPRPY